MTGWINGAVTVLSLGGAGFGVGWLVGLSESPVVGGVISVLLAATAGYVAVQRTVALEAVAMAVMVAFLAAGATAGLHVRLNGWLYDIDRLKTVLPVLEERPSNGIKSFSGVDNTGVRALENSVVEFAAGLRSVTFVNRTICNAYDKLEGEELLALIRKEKIQAVTALAAEAFGEGQRMGFGPVQLGVVLGILCRENVRKGE